LDDENGPYQDANTFNDLIQTIKGGTVHSITTLYQSQIIGSKQIFLTGKRSFVTFLQNDDRNPADLRLI